MRNVLMASALSLLTATASAETVQFKDRVGASFLIVKETKSESSGGRSSSSSSDRDTMMERVVGLSDYGLMLEYDLPKDADANARIRNWQFPARLLRSADGKMKLLNRPELDGRLEEFLKKANLPRSACGKWIFTWTAIKIECDPESALEIISTFDLRVEELQDGVMFKDAMALAPSPLSQTVAGDAGSTFTAKLTIDPEVVKKQRVRTDEIMAEMSGKQFDLKAAQLAKSKEQISGTIDISTSVDSKGQITRRTKTTIVEIKLENEKPESQKVIETLERRLIIN